MLLVLILFRLLLGIRVSYTSSYVFLLILLAFCRISRGFFSSVVGEVIFFTRILGYFHIIHWSLPSDSIKHVISGKWKVWSEEGALFFFHFIFFLKKKKSETPLNSEEDFTLDAGKRD